MSTLLQSGVMVPTPQYPIYSATIALLGGQKVGYFLNEKEEWALDVKELERTLNDAKTRGINVVAFVLINPGNPTGQVLPSESVKEVVLFCAKHRLVLLADEVYQENVYDDDGVFFSCKRAAYETGLLANDELELISFHSTSKGVFGECGRRGGYMELSGIDGMVKDHLYKLASASLCSTVSGQVMTSLMVRGPEPGGESYESHEAEKAHIFNTLKRSAALVSQGLDSIPGFSCQPARGSMYCFPSVELPEGAIDDAAVQGVSPDTLYAVSLLERTGICVVPASGFGQAPGRYGFRTTFLPPQEEMERAVEMIRIHHEEFWSKYQSKQSI
jgi:alanine transaminase